MPGESKREKETEQVDSRERSTGSDERGQRETARPQPQRRQQQQRQQQDEGANRMRNRESTALKILFTFSNIRKICVLIY